MGRALAECVVSGAVTEEVIRVFYALPSDRQRSMASAIRGILDTTEESANGADQLLGVARAFVAEPRPAG